MRRDIGSELIVAVIAIAALVFALMFAVLLAISSNNVQAEQETSVAESNVDSDIPTQTLTPTNTLPPEAPATATFEFASSVLVTETSTPTATFTHTPTPTPTATFTYTPTNTVTHTPTATMTYTVTYTSTPSPTNTLTATKTRTATATHTTTATISKTPTPSVTASYTATDTPTPTATDTSTPTETFTPTHTATSTLTHTSTVTPTSTETLTPTNTATPTMTASATATNTPTPLVELGILPTATPTQLSLRDIIEALGNSDSFVCPAPGNWQTYIIQPGDTLFAIALAVNTTVLELQTANCLIDADRITAGDEVIVPRQPLSPVSTFVASNTVDNVTDLAIMGCRNSNILITNLQAGQIISGTFELQGTVTDRDFLYYKIEVQTPSTEVYNFVLESRDEVSNDVLATINTSMFGTGVHRIRLSMVDITAGIPEDATCDIPVIFE